jgi:hypothetical protein
VGADPNNGIEVGIFDVGPDEANRMRTIARNSGLSQAHYFPEWTYV